MKWILALLLSFNICASEYQFDTNYTKIEHSWRGVSVADYKANLKGVGVTWWDNSDFGVRVGHLFGEKLYTKGRYESYVIDLKGITSLELLYRYELFNNLYIIGGISFSKIPVPITSIEENYFRNDSDNDNGLTVKVEKRLSNGISFGLSATENSRIKNKVNDEWTRTYSFYFTYTF